MKRRSLLTSRWITVRHRRNPTGRAALDRLQGRPVTSEKVADEPPRAKSAL